MAAKIVEMIEIDVKPLSVNDAWKGQRYKTDSYKTFEKECFHKLRPMNIGKPPYAVYYTFWFSNPGQDIDSPVKPFTDILQRKYGFNDKDIEYMEVTKVVTEKGMERIAFRIDSLENELDF